MKVSLVDLKKQYQFLREEILSEIDALFSSSSFIGGKYVKEFEQKFSEFCDAKHVIGVSNGTEAIHIGLRALGIGPGDEVILPTHTFVATSEAVRLVGAIPVFADIDEKTFNMDPQDVKRKITAKTKLIIPVHIYGCSADMDALEEIAKENNLLILGDAAQAHGATYKGKSITHYARLSTFSFYPGKNLGAYGDAGAVVTNDAELAEKIRKIHDHGRSQKYLHDMLGTNARLDALQAAILSIKLKHLDHWCEKRRALAAAYQERLRSIKEIQIPYLGDSENKHAMHLYVIRVKNVYRQPLLDYLKAHEIEAGIHYPIPLHLQPCNADLGYKKGNFPIAEKIADEIISLPLFPELEMEQLEFVCQTVGNFFKEAEVVND